ncbi:MAG: LecA/PA-IL family lectin [Bacteroidia bacterium]|nr:LecA/PA-IL family lectin [Bacteroidia bacterium]
MKKSLSLILCVLTSIAFGQKIAEVTIYSYDGSILYGTAKMKDIVLNTQYGKLNIPLKDVSQITFGLEKDESIASDINKNIQILANTNDEKSIRSASENISKYGIKAIYHLEQYLNKNPSTHSDNIQNLMNEILSANNISDYSFADAIIFSNGDKLSGNIDFKTIDFSNNFLSASIPVGKIKSMDVSYFESTDGSYSFVLKASKHIMANNNGGWLNTNIKVKKGQSIEISARGEIVLASLDNKKYTPDGNIVGQESVTNNETDPSYFNYGTLIFKIGNNGKNLKAGSNTKYIADADGVIYLTIYETVYSDKNTGSYQVKLSVK